MVKKWIQKAKIKEGAFTKKAKAAGMSVKAYRGKVLKNPDRYSTRTVRQANLAKTFEKLRKKRS